MKIINGGEMVNVSEIINNLLEFYNFNNKTVITVGAGGGQLIGYANNAKNILAIDNNEKAIEQLKENVSKLGLGGKYEYYCSDFFDSNLKADVILFEFCLHEIKNPLKALIKAQDAACDILIVDHLPNSEWAYIADEDLKVLSSNNVLNEFVCKKSAEFKAIQKFSNYDELYNKVSVQGENSISRIKKYIGQRNIEIEMLYGMMQL